MRRARRPELGSMVRVTGAHEGDVHLCTVVDLLDVQFRATYEVQRDDGGWREHSVYAFYAEHGDTWTEVN